MSSYVMFMTLCDKCKERIGIAIDGERVDAVFSSTIQGDRISCACGSLIARFKVMQTAAEPPRPGKSEQQKQSK